MTALTRLIAALMLLLAAAVGVNFLAAQFYDPMTEDAAATVWRILDPVMVVGLAIVVIVAFLRKRARDAETLDRSVDREYFEANFVFYYSAALFLLLLWNWFGVEFVDPPNDDGLLWLLIDVTLPLLLASTAIRLLREE